jgi:hypothetical protein
MANLSSWSVKRGRTGATIQFCVFKPWGIYGRGIMVNSIKCTRCCKWVHQRCSRLKRRLTPSQTESLHATHVRGSYQSLLSRSLGVGGVGDWMLQSERICIRKYTISLTWETWSMLTEIQVHHFSYLGDMVDADRDSNTAVTAIRSS